jgi:hypothetical protein
MKILLLFLVFLFLFLSVFGLFGSDPGTPEAAYGTDDEEPIQENEEDFLARERSAHHDA